MKFKDIKYVISELEHWIYYHYMVKYYRRGFIAWLREGGMYG